MKCSFSFSLALLILLLSIHQGTAQQGVSINTNGTSPDSSSILDVSSTTKGLLLPRMTTADRMAIANPANGLTVFDITAGMYCYRNGSEWMNILNNKSGWSLQGNALTGIEFIGTTSYHNLIFKANNVRSGLIDLARQNTFFGYNTAYAISTGSENVAIGKEALYTNSSGSQNTALGMTALHRNETGSSNVAVGFESAYWNETGMYNVAIGKSALSNNFTTNGNTAVGTSAMQNASDISSNVDTYNTAVGFYALTGENTSGNTGIHNTALGAAAMGYNSTGSQNSAFGSYALYYNKSGNAIVAGGYEAALDNTTGGQNVAIGNRALKSNKTKSGNTAIGASAMENAYSHTAPGTPLNTAVGYQSLMGGDIPLNNTGILNTALGGNTLKANISGQKNTATGANALDQNTAGSSNIAMGQDAMGNNLAGSFNTGVGTEALLMTKLSGNSAFGFFAGQNTEFSTNCTYLGRDADNNTDTLVVSNSTAIGYVAVVTAPNQVRIGNASITSIGGYEPWTDVSDGRYKNDVHADVPGLSFISKLRPVTYHLDVHGLAAKLNEDRASDGENSNGPSQATLDARNHKSAILKTGFVAQDVETVANELGYEFSGVDAPQSDDGLYGLRYSVFVVPLVKAVQEQQAMIESLQQENAALKNQYNTSITDLQQKLLHVEAMINEMKASSKGERRESN